MKKGLVLALVVVSALRVLGTPKTSFASHTAAVGFGSSALSPDARQQVSASEYLLASGRAGRIELGTSVDEMYQFFGRDHVRLVDLFKEGLFSPALEVTLPGATVAPAVVTDIREWPCGEFSVWGIDVRDPRFRTQDGFGVGSTAGDLRRLYSFELSEEEGGHAAIVKALQMSFSLTGQGPIDQQTDHLGLDLAESGRGPQEAMSRPLAWSGTFESSRPNQ